MTERSRIVVITGASPETAELVNNEPPDIEVWGINNAHSFVQRYDRWFQMHPRDWQRDVRGPDTVYGRDPGHLEFLKGCGAPVYQQRVDPEIPTSLEYPLQEVWDDIGLEGKKPYFTSTPGYAMALAIHEKVDEIRLYGFNLSTAVEYLMQRPNLEFLIGVATGRGIKVTIPNVDPLMRAPLYGYVDPTSDIEMAQARLTQARANWHRHCREYYRLLGKYEDSDDPYKRPKLRGEAVSHLEQMKGLTGQIREQEVWLALLGAYDTHASAVPPIDIPEDIRQLAVTAPIVRAEST